MSLPYAVSEKLVVSGQFVEHYTYQKPYWVGFPRLFHYSPHSRPSRPQTELRDDNVRRTRAKIRRLVNSNQDLDRFMTLTFDINKVKGNVFSLDYSNKRFDLFVKRLRYLYPDFKYLCVPEFQPISKRVHYHLLCNIPYLPKEKLEEIWTHGFVFLRKIDSVSNLGAYICKYLGKANFDSRYFKKRKFFYSFNLNRPFIIDKLREVRQVLANIPKQFIEYSYSLKPFLTKFLGMVEYKQLKLFDFIKVEDNLVNHYEFI